MNKTMKEVQPTGGFLYTQPLEENTIYGTCKKMCRRGSFELSKQKDTLSSHFKTPLTYSSPVRG
jgi:hypothetical protein